MKKLFLSAALLLVAALLLGTSTFAWFSMNDTVTATGMSVTCQNDSVYLLIMAGNQTSAATIQSNGKTTANATNASHSLLPAGHDTLAKKSDADDATKWFTAEAESVNASTIKTGSKVYLTSSNMSSYVLVNTFTLTVAKGASKMKDIKIKEISITSEKDHAVKVVVASATAIEEFSSELESGETGKTTTKDGSVTLQSALTDSTVMVVTIYIYWDGEDADVYTNGSADLQGTSVNVTFTGTIDNSTN